MLTQTPGVNGRVRKTLACQLDRLDALLEGFGPSLQQAIADAVQSAVAAAVREAAAQVRVEAPATAQSEAAIPVSPAEKSTPAESRLRRWARQTINAVRQTGRAVAAGVGLGLAAVSSRIRAAVVGCRNAAHVVVSGVASRTRAANARLFGFAAAVGMTVRSVVAAARGEPRAFGWGTAVAVATVVVLEFVDRMVLSVAFSLALGAGVAALVSLGRRLSAATFLRPAAAAD